MIKDREKNAREQRAQYEQQVARMRRSRGQDWQPQPLDIKIMQTETEQIVRDFERKGLADQCLLDTLNYGVNKFFQLLDNNSYITDKRFRAEIATISNQAAILFFFQVQIPLCRVSSAFSFLTCFLVWFIDHQSKQVIYEVSQCLFKLDFRGLLNILAQEVDYDMEQTPKKKQRKEDLRAVVDWYCLNLITAASFGFNYVYHLTF